MVAPERPMSTPISIRSSMTPAASWYSSNRVQRRCSSASSTSAIRARRGSSTSSRATASWGRRMVRSRARSIPPSRPSNSPAVASMKAYIVTLGCPKNLVDSEATASVLRGSGCEVTGDPAAADVLLVGACSFLDSSWRETVEETRKLSRYKRGGKKKRLVLMGCLPKHRSENLEAELPWVDHFLPTGAHARLTEMMSAWSEGTPLERTLALGDADRFAGFETREVLTASHTAYVKVAEGCNRKCTFCAIPLIRGHQVTRSADSILPEVHNLVEQGVREVTL